MTAEPYLWGAAAAAAAWALGYLQGGRQGVRHGLKRGRATAALLLRERALAEGVCPVCGERGASAEPQAPTTQQARSS